MSDRQRSMELMAASETVLLIIDVQERLLPAIGNGPHVVWNTRRLLDATDQLKIPALATEQYPRGLGPTVPEILSRLKQSPTEKRAFSCAACEGLLDSARAEGRHKILLVGVEAHVCVQQTALDLQADGWRVYIATDAIGSRFQVDHETAVARMEASGVVATTTESAMFEWCETSDRPEFRTISQLAQEDPPVGPDHGEEFMGQFQ